MSGLVPPSSRANARLKRRRNPATQTERAGLLYQRFTGHDAEEIGWIDYPDLDGASVAVIGDLDFVGYTTVRDGKVEKYIHEFAKKDRPLLAVTADGKTLILVGGNYNFTERGIVDRSDKSR